MKRYEEDDNVTFYFVVYEEDTYKTIRGWSDDKEVVNAYMEFHKCKKFRVQKMNALFSEVMQVLEENFNDEISLYNVLTRHPRHPDRTDQIVVPMTETEHALVNEEVNSFLASRINYGYINEAFHYLKEKYQKALKWILLEDVMKKVVYEKTCKFIQEVEVDELMVLYHSFPDQFGY